MNEFKNYKRWCKRHCLKPSNPDNLKEYLRVRK